MIIKYIISSYINLNIKILSAIKYYIAEAAHKILAALFIKSSEVYPRPGLRVLTQFFIVLRRQDKEEF